MSERINFEDKEANSREEVINSLKKVVEETGMDFSKVKVEDVWYARDGETWKLAGTYGTPN